ncbi:unnamed protein product, partial [marine sediment metagenome]
LHNLLYNLSNNEFFNIYFFSLYTKNHKILKILKIKRNMARSQKRSKRKYTGKKYKHFGKKRKRELASPPIETTISFKETDALTGLL